MSIIDGCAEPMSDSSILRLALLWEAPQPGPSWLETVVELAARLDAELEALYLEDPNLQRLAAWPAVREVCTLSGRPEVMAAGLLARELGIARRRAEEMLAAVAGRRKRPWRFEARAAALERAVSADGDAVLWVVDRVRGWQWLERGAGVPLRLLLAAAPVAPPVYVLEQETGPATALAGLLARAFGVAPRHIEGAGDPDLLRRVLAELVPGLVVAAAGGPWWHDGKILELLRRRPFSLLRAA